ncbi:MAG: hypothetical protein FJ286_09705 [Planctomycetes bacterium]|nr:hypothetical protein [Planctomycetota bacterium]
MLLVPPAHAARTSGGSSGSGFTSIDGETYVTIRNVEPDAPFLMNVVGNGDVWMFVGSNGGITAGRRDPDLAIFPYATVDKLLATPHASGPVCLIESEATLWEPGRGAVANGARHLHKHSCGTSVVFEETHEPLGLRLRWQLATSDEFGIVRRCLLKNVGRTPVPLRLLDGWHQMLPPGVCQHTFERYSYLAAAYMRHEFLGAGGPLVSCLNAAISDRPEPAESLRASVAWSFGHRAPRRTASVRSIDRFRSGGQVQSRDGIVRGEFGCYLVEDAAVLAADETLEWFTVVDTGLDHAAVVALHQRLEAAVGLRDAVLGSVRGEADGIFRRVAAADGLQASADRGVAMHHFSNTMFNIMRGGIPVAGHLCPGADVPRFVAARNRPVHDRHRGWLESLGDLDRDELVAAAAERGDPQLLRIVSEYLPICFSRRHGDPSRPWNRFSIATRGPDGRQHLAYAGNWRDIFQNWEALAWSHPACLPAMIAAFLNASTADGYNPYRITRDGIDWEVSNPNDPWSHIGYWGDHQIVYLTRLLELHERLRPGVLARGLDDPRYVTAAVPYRIKGFDDLLRDPRHSIDFDAAEHRRLRERMADIGGDGATVADGDGAPRLLSLAEKLLVPVLVKLTNLVPGGGIWLNTQRPEWNDANNALAGWGLSVVTVCHLRRHLALVERLVSTHAADLRLTRATADLLADVAAALDPQRSADAYGVFEALGRAGERHRAAVYAGHAATPVTVAAGTVVHAIRSAAAVVEQTISSNRRQDGMYHAYNRLTIRGRELGIGRLELMLEGQVAALSSGLLDDDAALALLEALRRSPLFRTDQRSYMLQPERDLTPFLERNRLPAEWRKRCPGLAARVAAGSTDVVVLDARGDARFHADLTNDRDLAVRLDREGLPTAESAAVRELWEEVFSHASFTGRSGTFFAFEGLGSIYWHMVAKLLLAVQECHGRASAATKPRFRAAYHAVRDGLGFRKKPEEYGAFPTDAYSHTPRHLGAQQPGMTGQVKEEILTRLGEVGVGLDEGRLRFAPELLDEAEFGPAAEFEVVAIDGRRQAVPVPAGGVAFTLCQVPVVYEPAGERRITVEHADGRVKVLPGDRLPADVTREILARSQRIAGIRVGLVRDTLEQPR